MFTIEKNSAWGTFTTKINHVMCRFVTILRIAVFSNKAIFILLIGLHPEKVLCWVSS